MARPTDPCLAATHVAVLMGGPSSEREVSLRSGAAVAGALRATGATVTEVLVVDQTFSLPAPTDVVFIALHGTFGEDGTVQRLLEQRGLPYTFSGPAASALAFDKVRSKTQFSAAGVATPRAEFVQRARLDPAWLPDLGWPVVVKPARQGSSVGITIARAPGEFAAACVAAGQHDDLLVIEEFIAGRELTVGVLDERPLPVIEVRPRNGWFTYEAKYTAGQTEYLVPAPLADAARDQAWELAVRAHQSLGCRDLSRVDIMLRADGAPFVLEVNTVPGFTATSLVPKAAAAAGLSFPWLCGRLVEKALSRRPVASTPAPVVERREPVGAGA